MNLKESLGTLHEVTEWNELTIEITSNRIAVINNCRGVLDCSQDEIVLYSKDKKVRILGSDLVLRVLTINSAVIEGTLMVVEMMEGGEE